MTCPEMPTVGQVPETNATPLPLSTVWMSSMEAPALQPYGEHRAAVRDAFDNVWYLAAPAA